MPFSVDDFQDLLRLLEARPEWLTELRQRVLTQELLSLPGLVRELAAAQTRTEQRLAEVVEAQATLTDRVDALAQRVDALAQGLEALTQRVDALAQGLETLTQRVDALAQVVEALTQRVDALAQVVEALVESQKRLFLDMERLVDAQGQTAGHLRQMADRVGDMDGRLLELHYARRAGAYFSRLARRVRVIDHTVLADLLDDAVQGGRLTDSERDSVLAADLVLRGQRREDGVDAYFVVEISAGVGLNDVRRARDRAGLLAKLGEPAVPVVAGGWINDEAEAMANSFRVRQVLDGRALPSGGE